MINDIPYSLIDEDLLEETDANANALNIQFYGRPTTKREIDKWAIHS